MKMTNIIELEDIEFESLSTKTLDLISQLTSEILIASGKSFSFNDPYLLPKIGKQVKALRNPQINALYYQYKFELKRSVKNGNFSIRPYRAKPKKRNLFSSALSPAFG